MAKECKLIYLDSCVILDCLIKDPNYYGHVEPILRDAEAGNLRIVLSVLKNNSEILERKTGNTRPKFEQ